MSEGSAIPGLDRMVSKARTFARPYRVTGAGKFRLEEFDPQDTGDLDSEDKPAAIQALASGVATLARMQEVLHAQDRWAVLLIFQAMDAAGKDGAIKHVTSGLNPQGCRVASFKAPSTEEYDHDFLWRCQRQLPERGQIGIFNRSYYEEVLVVRVHPEFLARQRIPPELLGKHLWKQRFQDIRAFERYLGRNGIVIRKFFLHVSRKEQKRRFLERIETPEKNWKFSAADVQERRSWKKYMTAYGEMIRHTATAEAPWYVVPADHKWYTRVVVAAAVVDALASLDLRYPEIEGARRAELVNAKKALLAER